MQGTMGPGQSPQLAPLYPGRAAVAGCVAWVWAGMLRDKEKTMYDRSTRRCATGPAVAEGDSRRGRASELLAYRRSGRRRLIASAAVVLPLMACDAIDNAKKAAEAAGELTESAQEFGKASKEAEKAGEAAAAEAQANVDPNASPEEQKQHVEMAKAMGALGALGNHAQGEGPVANWRQLAPFVPEKLGSFSAKGELDGKTQSMSGITVSHVSRRYEDGDQKARVKLTDTHFSSLMRAPFKMAALVKEDSSKGYKKGTEIDGHTAIVEWSRPRKTSKAMMLVAERYMLEVTVREATEPDAAQALAQAFELDKLSKLEPKDE